MARPGKIDEWSPFRAWSGKSAKSLPFQDMLAILLVGSILAFAIVRATALPEYDWNWQLLVEFIVRQGKSGTEPGLMLRGLFTTLRIGIWTILFSFVAGGLLGIAASSRSPLAVFLCRVFINILRSTPPLVILFCVYFFAGNILPVAPLENMVRHFSPFFREIFGYVFAQPGELDRMLAAVLALGIYQSAYVAEITRGALQSIPAGQWDAGTALGFSRMQCLRLVILPQALRLMLPPLTGQAITTFKDSALASLISLPDLTFQSLEIMAISGLTFEIWISSALLYLLVGGACAIAGHYLEKRHPAVFTQSEP